MGTQVPCRLLHVLNAMRLYLILPALFLHSVLLGQMGTPIGNDIGRTTMSEKNLKDVFLGKRALWTNGQAITVVLPSSDSRSFEYIAQWALGSDAFDYQKHWLSLVFQGRSNAPVLVKDEAAVIEYVKSHPGAIGIMHENPAPSDWVIGVQ